jgi:hypothetical protein
MLDELCSTSLQLTINIGYLVAAGLSTAVGAAWAAIGKQPVILIGGALLGLLFVLAFYLTRSQSLLLETAGASISVETSSMDATSLQEIIDTIEAAKNARYLGLKL